MSNTMPVKKIVKTKSAPRLYLALGTVLVGLGLVVFGLRGVLEEKVYIRTPKMLIRAEVADDEDERFLGLSGRDSLAVDRGMLFIFEKPDVNGIWMRDMRFAIDAVWLDSGKKVIAVERNVSPESYPKVFGPSGDSLYVIELEEGRASELDIKLGETLSW